MSQSDKNFIVYKSSAGSGKTFTLVREYLKIVLRDPELFRNVLAITFTNKAANEMKERMVRYLMGLSDPLTRTKDKAVTELLSQLTAQLNMSENQIFVRAEKVLKLIMHHYGEFSISTIDSFTHRVIRSFAHDLNIPMNFEVELDSDTMLAESVDELVSMVGTDPILTRVLVEFVEKKAGDELSWQIEKDLNEFGKALLKEDSIGFINQLRKYDLDTFMEVKSRLYVWRTRFEKQVTEIAGKALALASHAGLDDQSVYQKKRGVLNYLSRLVHAKSEVTLPNSYARTSLESGEWLGNSASPSVRSAFESVHVELKALGDGLIRILDNDFPRYSVCGLLLNNLFATALLGVIEKILSANCTEDNKILISEFNRRISAVVREQPAPFIYERLGERYHHYLLDEFQDTSVMQWHNLLPLIENALASYRLNLVVGDAKQAIYRWRSGDARQFEMLPGLIKDGTDPLLDDREKALKMHFREESLAMNHRSSPVIVDFNNSFFRSAVTLLPENYAPLYSASAQTAARKDKPGMVRIEIAPKKDPSGIAYDQIVHDKILNAIAELKSDGYAYKDITILCRKNEKAASIAAWLIHQGINVISSESLLLTQSARVNFLLAWAMHLHVKNDPVPLANIILYLTQSGHLTDVPFDLVCHEVFPSIYGDHSSKAGIDVDRFSEWLTSHFPDLKYEGLKNLDLPGLFHHLAAVFGFSVYSDSYLRFFMDFVLEFMKNKHGGIPEFLEWWDEKSGDASLIIPEGIDAVRIMTIHKAKGLQFPAVIFPFADEEFRTTKKNLWVTLEDDLAMPLNVAYVPVRNSLENTPFAALLQDERDLSELDMVNVLYVAMTRPEERLYIITKTLPAKTEGPLSLPKLFLNFLQSEGIFQEDKKTYQFGDRVMRKEKRDETVSNPEKDATDFRGRPALKLLLRKHAPASWEMSDPEKKSAWGILVHHLMADLKSLEDLDASVDRMILEGDIGSEEGSTLKKMTSALLNYPEVAMFFNDEYQVKSEAEILTREGISRRPDRVLLKGNKALIVDYKTGPVNQYHKEQVGDYAELLEKMGYDLDGAYLLYLNERPELVRVK